MPTSKNNRGGLSNSGGNSSKRNNQERRNEDERENVSTSRDKDQESRATQNSIREKIQRGRDFGNHLDEE
jgi:hypothetical protein